MNAHMDVASDMEVLMCFGIDRMEGVERNGGLFWNGYPLDHSSFMPLRTQLDQLKFRSS
jgi:hypothetical protein